ncbi:hypothetical protein B0H63DRAFT_517405 [Podospora didyma]|uniref:Uncharacterized protein n=1 Tax=Podospora didyma TaxID=330526 RepID=A0AAE0U8B1_9PEZI|nr:hypothetical protein B0H63DRAFT_517405 [Podospora didyma]
MSADTVSTLFPDRPIRPLPKRRLRERLSPEVADSIQYPPAPQNISPLFPYSCNLQDEEPADPSRPHPHERAAELERQARRAAGPDVESDDDEAVLRRGVANRTVPNSTGRLGRPPARSEHRRHTNSHLALSATSSVDGYDSFENTNNKKKRKIPTAGDSALNGVHVGNDPGAGAGPLPPAVQSAEGPGDTPTSASTSYYSSASFASGTQHVPGPGRGRYGRPRNGRSPLRPLSDFTNNWASARNGKIRPTPQWASGSSENTGVISAAIANAEKLPPQQGQENTSLLHQQPPTKRNPASAQFTFTCDAGVNGDRQLNWASSDRRMIGQTHTASARLAKESWQHSLQASQSTYAGAEMPHSAETGAKEAPTKNGSNGQSQQAPTQKASRRSAAKEYAAAARARRRETQLYNKRHPPKPDEVWICHFCEYESIFGHPPEALVRQYEMKDRKQRQLEQQRRAQWERMKKGKHKGKKNSKTPAKTTNSLHEPNQAAGAHSVPMNNNYSQGTQSEEYYDDEEYEDEDYDPDEELPPEGAMLVPSRHGNGSAHHTGSNHICHCDDGSGGGVGRGGTRKLVT